MRQGECIAYHHALEDVGLVVDVVEDVYHTQSALWERPNQRDEKSSYTHPKPVRKSSHRQRHHEDRCNVRHQHNETLGGEQIKEEPHDPHPEADSRGAEVGESVRKDGEDHANEEEVGEAGSGSWIT